MVLSSRYFEIVNEQKVPSEVLDILEEYFTGKDIVKKIGGLLEEADRKPEILGQYDIQSFKYLEQVLKLIYNGIDALEDNDTAGGFAQKLQGILDSFRIKKVLLSLYKEGSISSDVFIRDIKALVSFMQILKEIERLYEVSGFKEEIISIKDFTLGIEEEVSKKDYQRLEIISLIN
jgi:hypothetical protein